MKHFKTVIYVNIVPNFIFSVFICSYFIWGCYSLGCRKWHNAVHIRFKFTFFSALLCSGANSKFLFSFRFLKCITIHCSFLFICLGKLSYILHLQFLHCRIPCIQFYTVPESSVPASNTASADTSKFGLSCVGDCPKLHQSSILPPLTGAVASWGTFLLPSTWKLLSESANSCVPL
jgi:hypothetical protein